MGFYLGGRHEGQIDKFLEFLQGYLKKVAKTNLSKMHTVYFALKYTALHISNENVSWKEVLESVSREIKLDEEQFKAELEKTINPLKQEILEKIKRGEII
jgi:hypothetical protein